MFACSSPVMRLKTRFASSLISSVRPFQFIQWVSDFSIFSLLLGLRVSVPFAHAHLPYRRGGVASSLQGRGPGGVSPKVAGQKNKIKNFRILGTPGTQGVAVPCAREGKALSSCKRDRYRKAETRRGSVSAEAKREAE